MKLFIGSLITFGFLFIGISYVGYYGFLDDLINKLNTYYGVEEAIAATKNNTIIFDSKRMNSDEFWNAMIYFMTRVACISFFFMGLSFLTSAVHSYRVSLLIWDFFWHVFVHNWRHAILGNFGPSLHDFYYWGNCAVVTKFLTHSSLSAWRHL